MKFLHWLRYPTPQPALVLLAVILTIFGTMALRIATALGAALIVFALVLLVSFVRALKQDLELKKVGVTATARVTRIEQKTGKFRGKAYDVWQVHYVFNDTLGVEHADVTPVDDPEEAQTYRVGGTFQLRYHPDNPEIRRWLD